MSLMESNSRRLLKIVDSCILIDCAQKKTLPQTLLNLSKSYDVLIVSCVRVETEDYLQNVPEENLVLYFKKTIRDLTSNGVIRTSRKFDRLNSGFKALKHYLKGIPVRVEDIDRHIIALACQEKAEIHTTDPGIKKALKILTKAKSARRWHQYADKVKINVP